MRSIRTAGFVAFAVTSLMPATLDAQVLRANVDGVAYVTTERPLWNAQTAWAVGSIHTVQIGLAAGNKAYVFNHPAPIRLSDGRFVVGDMGTGEVRFFESSGRHIRTVGGKGVGPGKFSQIMGLRRLAGDSVLVIDADRLSVLTRDGKFARAVAEPARDRTRAPLSPAAVFPDGAVIMIDWPQGDARRTGTWTDSANAFLFSPDGTQSRALGPFAAATFAFRNDIAMNVQFGPSFTMAAGTDAFVYNFPTAYQIKVFNRDGKLARVIERAWTPVAVTSDDIRRFSDQFVNERDESGRSTPEFRAFREKRLQQMSFAKTHAAHGPMMFDSEGYLWVRDGRPILNTVGRGFAKVSADPISYDVFDTTGAWLGAVQLPPRFKVTDIGRDYVLGVYLDDNDVEFVRSYRIINR